MYIELCINAAVCCILLYDCQIRWIVLLLTAIQFACIHHPLSISHWFAYYLLGFALTQCIVHSHFFSRTHHSIVSESCISYFFCGPSHLHGTSHAWHFGMHRAFKTTKHTTNLNKHHDFFSIVFHRYTKHGHTSMRPRENQQATAENEMENTLLIFVVYFIENTYRQAQCGVCVFFACSSSLIAFPSIHFKLFLYLWVYLCDCVCVKRYAKKKRQQQQHRKHTLSKRIWC